MREVEGPQDVQEATMKGFRLEKVSKWLVVLSSVVAGIFAIQSLDLSPGTLVGFVHRVSDLHRQVRINALLRDSILLTADRVVERPSLGAYGTDTGYKRVTIYLRIRCQRNLPFPVVPKCFTLVDSLGQGYQPLAASALFVEKGEEFWLQEGEVLKSSLFFEIPKDARPYRLRFNQPR